MLQGSSVGLYPFTDEPADEKPTSPGSCSDVANSGLAALTFELIGLMQQVINSGFWQSKDHSEYHIRQWLAENLLYMQCHSHSIHCARTDRSGVKVLVFISRPDQDCPNPDHNHYCL